MKWLQSVQSDRKPSRTFLYRNSGRSFLRNMAAVRSGSPERRRLVRAAPALRRHRRSGRCRTARALRGRRPLGAGCPLATLDADRKHLRPGESEADLLSVDGISDRALALQQYHQSSARSLREAKSPQQENIDWLGLIEARTRCRPGKRRARAPGGLLSRLDGDDAAPGHGLWAALRIRHVQTVHPGRLAARRAGQLAAPPGSVGGPASGRDGRSQAQLLVRDARWTLAARTRPALLADRHTV